MSFICKVCGKEFDDLTEFNRHFWKDHRISMAQYYETYEPRHDLYTGEKIFYKKQPDYLDLEFANKKNLYSWCIHKATKKEAQDKIVEYYARRIERTASIKELSEVELTKTSIPAKSRIVRFFPDLKELYDRVGVKSIYNGELKLRPWGDSQIIIDTAEQKPLSFSSIPCHSASLDYGDYAVIGELFDNVFIERKSGADFIGTLSQGYERFLREVKRAEKANAYIVVLVEAPLSKMLTFERNFYGRYNKANSDFVFKRVREIMQKHNNIQFLFVKNRGEAAAYTKKIFQAGQTVQNVDLQFLYNNKKF